MNSNKERWRILPEAWNYSTHQRVSRYPGRFLRWLELIMDAGDSSIRPSFIQRNWMWIQRKWVIGVTKTYPSSRGPPYDTAFLINIASVDGKVVVARMDPLALPNPKTQPRGTYSSDETNSSRSWHHEHHHCRMRQEWQYLSHLHHRPHILLFAIVGHLARIVQRLPEGFIFIPILRCSDAMFLHHLWLFGEQQQRPDESDYLLYRRLWCLNWSVRFSCGCLLCRPWLGEGDREGRDLR